MSEREPSEVVFAEQVAGHQMIVGIDSDLYRHLTFKRPETSNRYFHITTWPGYLTISGDMGCYVFSRLPDMFEFFRDDKGRINPGYWSEKIQADERHSGHREFSETRWRQCVEEDFSAWHFDSDEQKAKAREELEDDLFYSYPESVEGALTKTMDYKCSVTGHHFQDFWDHTLTDYTYHFIWCCRAIVWAIERYDEYKADERFPGLASIHACLSQTEVAA